MGKRSDKRQEKSKVEIIGGLFQPPKGRAAVKTVKGKEEKR